MDINQKVTEELGVKRWQVDAAVNLIDEGYTIPFISRYWKAPALSFLPDFSNKSNAHTAF